MPLPSSETAHRQDRIEFLNLDPPYPEAALLWGLEVQVRICMTARPLADSGTDSLLSSQLELTAETTHNSGQLFMSPRGNINSE